MLPDPVLYWAYADEAAKYAETWRDMDTYEVVEVDDAAKARIAKALNCTPKDLRFQWAEEAIYAEAKLHELRRI